MHWQGVVPAITTQFHSDLSIDPNATCAHADWMIENGCRGIVACGSLGESATLSHEEKVTLLSALCEQAGARYPIVCGVAALGTADAVRLAQDAERVGCQGLMVLPQYVYVGDWRENRAHIDAVCSSVGIDCMLYNNPIAYSVDYSPEHVAELAEANGNLVAIKESSADVRRVTELRRLLGDRLAIFIGVDDLICEAVPAGVQGWIAGLVNAFPAESVRLFDLCVAGRYEEAYRLYHWFLPLLRLDVVPKFVQLIKLVQQEVGRGSERVRPPRLAITGPEREAALEVLRQAMQVPAAVR